MRAAIIALHDVFWNCEFLGRFPFLSLHAEPEGVLHTIPLRHKPTMP